MNKQLRNVALLTAGLMVSPLATAAIDGTYSEDFEGCILSDLNGVGAITDVPVPPQTTCATSPDLAIFGAVFDPASAFLYGYGSFPAPNNASNTGAAFSGLQDDQAGPNQGTNTLNFFNDYNNTGEHDGGINTVEASIFQEWTIDAADLNKTWVFRFDYKQGDIGGVSTANAFIKTIAPFLNYAQTNAELLDINNGGQLWVEGIEISLYLDGSVDDVNNTTGAAGADGVPDLQGQLFQVGFNNTSVGYSPTGMAIDNLQVFEGAGAIDTDGDGIDDSIDNCTLVANASQLDGDSDGYGNKCDADLNNSCGAANFGDLIAFKGIFGTTAPEGDMNDSGGAINFGDLIAFKGLFGTPPGPSAAGTCP